MFKRMYSSLGPDLFWMTRVLVRLSDSILDRLSRMLLYSRSMELQLNCGIPLEVALLEGERLFSSSHQKNLKKVRSQIASGVSIQEAFSRHSGFRRISYAN